MASHHSGYDLISVKTELVCLTIKGPSRREKQVFNGYANGDSVVRIKCRDSYAIMLNGIRTGEPAQPGCYYVQPLFYEQTNYEIVIIGNDNSKRLQFWHDSPSLRNNVTPIATGGNILTGLLNFKNEIGMSDLVILLDGQEYLRVVIEVFPCKINYKDDYREIIDDVTREVYNLVFDFLKKTYHCYQQGDSLKSSPVEFFAIIQKIFADYIKAADLVLSQPHHILETKHEVLRGDKIRNADKHTSRWLLKHPEQVDIVRGKVRVASALAARKRVTYDTKENRFIKYILQSTTKKLRHFKRHYLKLQRDEDAAVISKIDLMVKQLDMRSNLSFLSDVDANTMSSGLSLVFSMAPGYRDLFKYYLMLQRGLTITGDVFNISVKDLALLYEYWCFIKLNSLLKEKYRLIRQDIIKTHGNGLCVTLVKGQKSQVVYKDPNTGDEITLSYNPEERHVPTVAQRPDNVLKLEKLGASCSYEYVFDAKYRINMAHNDSSYKRDYRTPGPELDDINTMHRYRDAIVYGKEIPPFERTMFGAYVLFPYKDEIEYKQHALYKSIAAVNIGGLPFLPSATKLVSAMLDELISEAPDSAFERATLPRGIEEKLAKIDWSLLDVLVGALRDKKQLQICLDNNFYHIPQRLINNNVFKIQYVALYQSKKLFGNEAGILRFGEVESWNLVKRSEIKEIPRQSDELYYRFHIKKWNDLPRAITAKEFGRTFFLTNKFLLEHCAEVPELLIRNEMEFRLNAEIKRMLNDSNFGVDEEKRVLTYGNIQVVFENSRVKLIKSGNIILQQEVDVESFSKYPKKTLAHFCESLRLLLQATT